MRATVPRPPKPRRVGPGPAAVRFKPAGVRARDLPEVCLTLDEFEAIRCTDYNGEKQDTAAARMGVSRQTYGLILASARQKMAQVVVTGAALRIQGGNVERPRSLSTD